MNERGEEGMGFSQSTTLHHFLLQASGGTIQVALKDSKDTAGRDHIRHHLAHIANSFAKGDFDIPIFVHDATPPGVPEMKKLCQTTAYSFEETPNGGQVVIRTTIHKRWSPFTNSCAIKLRNTKPTIHCSFPQASEVFLGRRAGTTLQKRFGLFNGGPYSAAVLRRHVRGA